MFCKCKRKKYQKFLDKVNKITKDGQVNYKAVDKLIEYCSYNQHYLNTVLKFSVQKILKYMNTSKTIKFNAYCDLICQIFQKLHKKFQINDFILTLQLLNKIKQVKQQMTLNILEIVYQNKIIEQQILDLSILILIFIMSQQLTLGQKYTMIQKFCINDRQFGLQQMNLVLQMLTLYTTIEIQMQPETHQQNFLSILQQIIDQNCNNYNTQSNTQVFLTLSQFCNYLRESSNINSIQCFKVNQTIQPNISNQQLDQLDIIQINEINLKNNQVYQQQLFWVDQFLIQQFNQIIATNQIYNRSEFQNFQLNSKINTLRYECISKHDRCIQYNVNNKNIDVEQVAEKYNGQTNLSPNEMLQAKVCTEMFQILLPKLNLSNMNLQIFLMLTQENNQMSYQSQITLFNHLLKQIQDTNQRNIHHKEIAQLVPEYLNRTDVQQLAVVLFQTEHKNLYTYILLRYLYCCKLIQVKTFPLNYIQQVENLLLLTINNKKEKDQQSRLYTLIITFLQNDSKSRREEFIKFILFIFKKINQQLDNNCLERDKAVQLKIYLYLATYQFINAIPKIDQQLQKNCQNLQIIQFYVKLQTVFDIQFSDQLNATVLSTQDAFQNSIEQKCQDNPIYIVESEQEASFKQPSINQVDMQVFQQLQQEIQNYPLYEASIKQHIQNIKSYCNFNQLMLDNDIQSKINALNDISKFIVYQQKQTQHKVAVRPELIEFCKTVFDI